MVVRGRRYASILSAVGIARADVVHEQQEPVAAVLGGGAHVAADLDARLGRLEAATRDALARQVRLAAHCTASCIPGPHRKVALGGR